MKYRDHQELYKDFPEIRELAERLEESERDAQEENDENDKRYAEDSRGSSEQSPFNNQKNGRLQRPRRRRPEEAHVIEYHKNGVWSKTMYKPRAGRGEFEDTLDKLLTSYDPTGVKIILHPGQNYAKDKIILKKTFWLTEGGEAPEGEEETNNPGQSVIDPKQMQEELLGKLEERIAPLLQEKGNSGDQKYAIMRLGFDMQLKEIQHKQDIANLQNSHTIAVNELNREIEDLKDYIVDLEEEIEEQDGELGGLKKEVEKKKEMPGYVELGATILGKGIVQVLKKNPGILDKTLGITPDVQNKMWSEMGEDTSSNGSSGGGGSENSFEAVSDNDFEGLDEQQVKGIKNIIEVMKSMNLDNFKKIWYFFDIITNENGSVNDEYLEQVYAALHAVKEQRSK